MDRRRTENGEFSADEFVDLLEKEGTKVSCDETNDDFCDRSRLVLPPFYDDEKFKRGQRFFHRNIFSMLFTKILGLITILSVPDLVSVLKFTAMSGKPMTAYKRYLSTVLHMCVWYDSDFTPGSSLWKSIEGIRNKHNSASKRCFGADISRITQKNMALTQFGFMGYAVYKSEVMGIHNAKREDVEAFVHLWRVIGYLMGIEDRFNICRELLDETQNICRSLADQIFKPEVTKNHPDYLNMSSAMINGMWSVMPVLETTVLLHFISVTISGSNNNNNDDGFKLNIFQWFYFELLKFSLYMCKFTVWRLFHNYNMYFALWFMHNCPFIAYYRFGKINSQVIISEHTKYS